MKEENKIDPILKQAFKDSTLDSPSGDFTMDIMSKINALESKSAITYKSLISAPFKILISLIFVSVIVYFAFTDSLESSSILSQYVQLPDFTIDFEFSKFEINQGLSNTLLYAAIFFVLLFGYQVHAINKKWIVS